VKFCKAASTLVLYVVVCAGVAVVATAQYWWPAVGHLASASSGPLPGARRKPTPEEMETARRTWMIRKFGRETNGPTVEQVIDYHNRNRVGPPSPPDVLEPVQ